MGNQTALGLVRGGEKSSGIIRSAAGVLSGAGTPRFINAEENSIPAQEAFAPVQPPAFMGAAPAADISSAAAAAQPIMN